MAINLSEPAARVRDRTVGSRRPARRTSCVRDIATHAAHLAGIVSRLPLAHVRAESRFCGAPEQLEATFFAWLRRGSDAPGTLKATRLVPGNRAGPGLRLFGSEGGLEWNLDTATGSGSIVSVSRTASFPGTMATVFSRGRGGWCARGVDSRKAWSRHGSISTLSLPRALPPALTGGKCSTMA